MNEQLYINVKIDPLNLFSRHEVNENLKYLRHSIDKATVECKTDKNIYFLSKI